MTTPLEILQTAVLQQVIEPSRFESTAEKPLTRIIVSSVQIAPVGYYAAALENLATQA